MVSVVAKILQANSVTNCKTSFLKTLVIAGTYRRLQLPLRYHGPWLKKQQMRFTSSEGGALSHLSLDGEKNLLSKDQVNSNKCDELNEPQSAVAPWYLQVNTPLRPPRPLSEKQQIPDLPESSPVILEPLLQQISVNLGLDNLTLLDLRHLDPPPTLGANLLMVIGTVRSKKHLHVSADRLCRWLRSQYKLNPDADGLLGRNELKLKMRRKNRKAKLVGSSMAEEDTDDGVRTGWVCINIGTVEGPVREEKVEKKREDFVGFGTRASGVDIVIQMLTEEKREELDLESLWNATAQTHSLLRSDASVAFEDAELEADTTKAMAQSLQSSPPMIASKPSKPNSFQALVLKYSMSSRSRAFHTSAIWRWPLSERVVGTGEFNGTSPTLSNQSTELIQQKVLDAINSDHYDIAKGLLLEHNNPEFRNDKWRPFLLNCLRLYLQNLPVDQAIRKLGSSYLDTSSTPFLSCAYETLSGLPSIPEWEFYVWMNCFATYIGHNGYTLNNIIWVFRHLRLSGASISSDIYLMVLRSALGNGKTETETNVKLIFAQSIIHDMEYRLGSVLTEEVFVAVQEAIQNPAENGTFVEPPPENDSFDLPTRPLSKLRSQLDTLTWTLEVPINRDESRIRLLNLYAKKDQWVLFWKFWRSIALQGKPRSPALYSCMFRHVANTNHQQGCMTVLRTWIHDMDREVPVVKLEGEVRDAVLACLTVADPLVELDAISDLDAVGEWLNLWRRCLR